MDWTTMAIVGTALLGVASIVDSHLLTKRLPSVRSLLLPASFIHLTFSAILFYMYPLPESLGFAPMLAITGSGVLRTAAVFIMVYLLKKEEVSRVIPIMYTSPIFVAVLAVPILGEQLYYLQYLSCNQNPIIQSEAL